MRSVTPGHVSLLCCILFAEGVTAKLHRKESLDGHLVWSSVLTFAYIERHRPSIFVLRATRAVYPFQMFGTLGRAIPEYSQCLNAISVGILVLSCSLWNSKIDGTEGQKSENSRMIDEILLTTVHRHSNLYCCRRVCSIFFPLKYYRMTTASVVCITRFLFTGPQHRFQTKLAFTCSNSHCLIGRPPGVEVTT
ncbi:hypothetical protein ARMGADRAFT_1069053 [Armillaria gallica]|uniref:Secreted protein n=1 Tax=Armillaria gallica TaxID=47427 RepID=A0A2H3CM57_ARMGA|nr:hypothetical protein ARMGADRAFT_1069053 [Armillaria gallica]